MILLISAFVNSNRILNLFLTVVNDARPVGRHVQMPKLVDGVAEVGWTMMPSPRFYLLALWVDDW